MVLSAYSNVLLDEGEVKELVLYLPENGWLQYPPNRCWVKVLGLY